MAQYVETPCRALPAGGALALYLRVKASGGLLVLAGAADWGVELGTVEFPAFASGDEVPVRLRHAPGTRKMVAAGAISAFAPIYPAANGQVTATAGGLPQIGQNMVTAAANAGDVIEAMYFPPTPQNFVNLTDVAALTPVIGDVPVITTGGALKMLAPGTSGQSLNSAGAGEDVVYGS